MYPTALGIQLVSVHVCWKRDHGPHVCWGWDVNRPFSAQLRQPILHVYGSGGWPLRGVHITQALGSGKLRYGQESPQLRALVPEEEAFPGALTTGHQKQAQVFGRHLSLWSWRIHKTTYRLPSLSSRLGQAPPLLTRHPVLQNNSAKN